MNYRSYGDLAQDIRGAAHKLRGDWDLVVGIPRSGMIPAFMIALMLNLDCVDLAAWVSNAPLKRGVTRNQRHRLTHPHEAQRVLLVDDSILSGRSLRRELEALPEPLRRRATTLAVYSSRLVRRDVDIVLCYLSHPRVFEWNVYHHPVVARACMSLEGVIAPVEDPLLAMGEAVPALLVPSETIRLLVSRRPESSRVSVERWLDAAGVKYASLAMLGDAVVDSHRPPALAQAKAGIYARSDARLYYEADDAQARLIVKQSNKPVFCVGTNEMLRPGFYYDPASNLWVRRVLNQYRKLWGR
ncbi:phosphoribosyltransferase family protein [Billgrantia lactosivorans]|uniref:phosphoribosyltransferase family protein n=1 Tax=Billgrantia lactosivorans TaxID=2185141 RepID=UPI000DAEC059|nr:phosphoribosyltransferase family protein [Halomonas lactosivorans]